MTDAGRALGRGIAFPPGIDAEGRMAWSEGVENIRQSIRIVLTTERLERIMLPAFGAGLKSFLFRPDTAATHRLIEEA
ncbi:MAG: GPW/gp25 family protein, partial [Pseudomonadota bacterium]|nr:GPW/gp25 family protein [Pseudomonadota bacterium]